MCAPPRAHIFCSKKKFQGAIQQVRGAEGAPNLLDSGPGTFFLKKKLCAPGGAHIFSFKKKLAEIEKGCPLSFGGLAGSSVDHSNFEVRFPWTLLYWDVLLDQ